MTKQREVRIAIVGAGLMGSTHASTLTFSTKNVVISHIVDKGLARAADVAEPIDGAVATTALQPALEDCDGVIITAPDEYHREPIEQVLVAGKPVLCEKPLATTLEDCLGLLNAESQLSRPLISLGLMFPWVSCADLIRDTARCAE
ncbi:MAG: Gfo/Idh/MocA family oxidoreductase [Antricoccus sp.]